MILKNAFVDESVDPRGKIFQVPKGRLIRGRVTTSSSPIKPFERFRIRRLKSRDLKEPLEAVVERDGTGYIARILDLPSYGYGEDIVEAVDVLKEDIESLYEELLESDNLSQEWKRIKLFLLSIVSD